MTINNQKDKLKQEIEARLPTWFLRMFVVNWIGFIILFFIIFYFQGFKISSHPVALGVIFFVGFFGGIWFFTFGFVTLRAKGKFVEVENFFGPKKTFPLDEIIEIRKPILGIPREFIYIITKNGEKAVLLRGMRNIKEFVEYLQTHCKNLKKMNV